MTELEQQALLAPPAQRTVRAVPGSCWYGVDPGTLRVSIACQFPDERAPCVATRSFARFPAGGQRLGHIYAETVELVQEIGHWPGIVLVEQPSGDRPNPALQYATGAIMTAIYRALADSPRGQSRDTPPILVETIPSPTWKLAALGRGDAGSKKRGGKAEIVRWAQENGYAGALEDESDAWAIATAARKLVAFA